MFSLKTSWLLLLLQIFRLVSPKTSVLVNLIFNKPLYVFGLQCSATVTFDSKSTKAFKDVAEGSKHYALFKVSKDFTIVSFVKVSDGGIN